MEKIYFQYLKYFLEQYLKKPCIEHYINLIINIFKLIQNHILYEREDFFEIAKYISNQLYEGNISNFKSFLNILISIINSENFLIKPFWNDFIKYFDDIIYEKSIEIYDSFFSKIISVIIFYLAKMKMIGLILSNIFD